MSTYGIFGVLLAIALILISLSVIHRYRKAEKLRKSVIKALEYPSWTPDKIVRQKLAEDKVLLGYDQFFSLMESLEKEYIIEGRDYGHKSKDSKWHPREFRRYRLPIRV